MYGNFRSSVAHLAVESKVYKFLAASRMADIGHFRLTFSYVFQGFNHEGID